jgi:hypothetical protein
MKAVVKARRNSSILTRFVKTFKLYLSPTNIFTKEDRQLRLNWWGHFALYSSPYSSAGFLIGQAGLIFRARYSPAWEVSS